VCRNPTRGAEALATLSAEFPSAKLFLHQLDVSSLPAVKRFCELFKGPVDVLVNNAGVLLGAPARTAEGHELTYATNVLGPFVLTSGLMPKLLVAKGRVITVSSGGMLLTKLSLPVLQGQVEKFDGVVAYAQTKRAEVIVSELWAARQPEVTFASMHPGWADTPGVSGSLPRFYDLMKGRLRTAAQGADTVTWLAVAPRLASTSGLFWFDRAPAATHPLRWTRESPEDREALLRECEAVT
jgi:NAD(P)-dependent dehydrogenase (short-subunit alcohol dehydrogenase family)